MSECCGNQARNGQVHLLEEQSRGGDWEESTRRALSGLESGTSKAEGERKVT